MPSLEGVDTPVGSAAEISAEWDRRLQLLEARPGGTTLMLHKDAATHYQACNVDAFSRLPHLPAHILFVPVLSCLCVLFCHFPVNYLTLDTACVF
jgi:hypothetical protein